MVLEETQRYVPEQKKHTKTKQKGREGKGMRREDKRSERQ